MDRSFEYDAFLSYSHADAAFSRRLQLDCERRFRRLGQRLRGGKKALRLCRDETDLTAAPDAWTAIEAMITLSRCLIVVCSPAARRSPWVDREIEAYRRSHGTRGAEGVVAVLIDGAEPVTATALPRALLEGGQEPLAVEFRRSVIEQQRPFESYCRDDGALRVLAPLLGVGYPQLADREAKQRRRRFRQRAALAALILTVLGGVGLYTAHQSRLATSRRQAAAAWQTPDADPQQILRDALAAVETWPSFEAEDGLRRALLAARERRIWTSRPSDGATRVLATHLGPHRGAVALGRSETVEVRDLLEDRQIASFAIWGGPPKSTAFSGDGRRLFAAAEYTCWLWDVVAGRRVGVASAPRTYFSLVALDTGGRRVALAGSTEGSWLWDSESGEPPRPLAGCAREVTALRFDPAGERLAVACGDGLLRLVDAASGAERTVLRDGYGSRLLEWSPDGRFLASAGWSGGVRVWDLDQAAQAATVEQETTSLASVRFSEDGQRLLVAAGRVALWDAATGQLVRTFPGGWGQLAVAAFTAGRAEVIAVWEEGAVRIWDAESGAERLALRGPPVASGAEVEVTANGRFLLVDAGGVISGAGAVVLDLAPAHEVAILRGHTDLVFRFAFSPEGRRLVTVAGDGTAWLWNLETFENVTVLRARAGSLLRAAFDRAGRRLATGSSAGQVAFWDGATGEPLATLAGHTAQVWSLDFDPAGERLVTASEDGTARLWDVPSGRLVAVLARGRGAVSRAAFNPGGTLVVTADSAGVALWEAATGKPRTPAPEVGDDVVDFRFPPGAGRLVTEGEDKALRLWDLSTGRLLDQRPGFYPDEFGLFQTSPDGRETIYAFSDENTAWVDGSFASGSAELRGHDCAIGGAAFNRDASRVVTASCDGTARIWNTATGAPLSVLRGHRGKVWSVAWSPDDRLVLTVDGEGDIRVFYAAVEDLIELARSRRVREP